MALIGDLRAANCMAAIVLLGLVQAAWAELSTPPGMRRIEVAAPERAAMLEVTLWYPAGVGGTAVAVGDNAVFVGTPARENASVADGRYPLILLAHGGLRSAAGSGAWIAARLAAQGYVVAAAQPPRITAERAASAPYEVSLRPSDLSATLAALTDEPSIGPWIDQRRTGVLGFHLGGTTALALAGARIDPELYARSCDGESIGPDCGWYARHGVDLHGLDPARIGRSNREPRVGAVLAVDPELVTVFTSESLNGTMVPVGLVHLGGQGMALALPEAEHWTIDGADHFSAFALCKPQGSAILREDGEDAICGEAGQPRVEVHARLARMIADFFDKHLSAGG